MMLIQSQNPPQRVRFSNVTYIVLTCASQHRVANLSKHLYLQLCPWKYLHRDQILYTYALGLPWYHCVVVGSGCSYFVTATRALPGCPIYQHRLTLIPAWIGNQMPSKMWNEITYPYPNFNGCTVFVREMETVIKKTGGDGWRNELQWRCRWMSLLHYTGYWALRYLHWQREHWSWKSSVSIHRIPWSFLTIHFCINFVFVCV